MKHIKIIVRNLNWPIVLLVLSFHLESYAQVTPQTKNGIAHNLELALKKNTPYSGEILNRVKEDNAINFVDNKFAESCTFFELDSNKLAVLFSENPEVIEMTLSLSDGHPLNLMMTRYDIYSEQATASAITENGRKEINAEVGLHYRGIVNGNENHWIALSITSDQIIGIATTHEGNWVIGKMRDQPYYVVYNDQDLKIDLAMECAMTAPDTSFVPQQSLNNSDQMQTCPIDLYWVGGYNLFASNGYNTSNSGFYLGAIFNNVATLYQNEGVQLVLGNWSVYTVPDPYSETDIVSAFLNFGQNVHLYDPYFPGHDLAMFIEVDFGNNPVGIAVIDAFCSEGFYYDGNMNNTQGRFATTRIPYSFNGYPTFSNTIFTVSHEMGHNLGSRHTHWCGWPGGAIDNCVVPAEVDNWGNSCAPGPDPGPSGGTVMSYCPLVYGSIPLANGFGFYPHQEIISDIAASDACICSGIGIEDLESENKKLKIFPQPGNEYIQIQGLNSESESYILYDFSGKIIEQGITNGIIQTSNIVSGIYLLRIRQVNLKIIITH